MGQKLVENLVGQRIGNLVVLSQYLKRVGKDNGPKSMCYCKCDCGNEKEFLATNLIRAKTGRTGHYSCGCKWWHRQNYVGNRYGKLVVLELDCYKIN